MFTIKAPLSLSGSRLDHPLVWLLVCQVTAFALLYEVWLTGSGSFLNGGWDMTYQTFSWLSFNWNALQNGEIPWWNFNSGSGISQIGELQPGVLYPPTWLFALWVNPDDPWWADVFIISHYGIAMQTMLVLLRGQGLSLGASLCGALIYAFAGGVAGRAAAQANLFFGLVWMPLLVHGCLLAMRSPERAPQWRGITIAAIAAALSVLAGHVHGAIGVFFALGVIAVSQTRWRAWRDWQAQPLVQLGLIGALAVLLTLPQLVATDEYLRHALKWAATIATEYPHRVPFELRADLAAVPADLLGLWNPGFVPSVHEVGSLYLTIPGCLLLLLVWLLPSTHPNLRRIALIGALAALLLATVALSHLGKLVLDLPVLRDLRSPARALHAFHLFAAVLIALGFDGCRLWLQQRSRNLSLVFASGLGLWLCWSLVVHMPRLPSPANILPSPASSTLGPPLLQKLRELDRADGHLYRFSLEPRDLYSPNLGDVLELRGTQSYRSSMPVVYFHQHLAQDWSMDSVVQDRLAARYLLTRQTYPQLTELARDGEVRLYQRASAHAVLVGLSADAGAAGPVPQPLPLSRARWQVNSVRFEFSSPVSGTVRFAQVPFPRWYFRTDRLQDWQKVGVQQDLMTAQLDGANWVEFAYRPSRFYRLLATSGSLALLLVLLPWFLARRTAARPATAPLSQATTGNL